MTCESPNGASRATARRTLRELPGGDAFGFMNLAALTSLGIGYVLALSITWRPTPLVIALFTLFNLGWLALFWRLQIDSHASDLPVGSGFGLLGMRERIALLGGTVRAGAVPGRGWRVEVRVPLTSARVAPRSGASLARDGASGELLASTHIPQPHASSS